MADQEKIKQIHRAAAEKAIDAYIEEVLKQLEGSGLTLKDWHSLQIGHGAVIVTPDTKEMLVAHVFWKFSADEEDLEKALGRTKKSTGLPS